MISINPPGKRCWSYSQRYTFAPLKFINEGKENTVFSKMVVVLPCASVQCELKAADVTRIQIFLHGYPQRMRLQRRPETLKLWRTLRCWNLMAFFMFWQRKKHVYTVAGNEYKETDNINYVHTALRLKKHVYTVAGNEYKETDNINYVHTALRNTFIQWQGMNIRKLTI